MSAIAPATEPRHPRRKKPRVPSPLFEPKGHRSTIKGVSRIYLEDIVDAYRVMEECVSFSPTAQWREEHYQQMQALDERTAALYRQLGQEEKLAEFVPAEVPRPIKIETSEYEPAYSLEELTAIPQKRSAELTMSIGYGDLRLRCTAQDCDVSTNEESPEALLAFRQLVAILEARVNRVAAMLLSLRFLLPLALTFIGLSAVGIVMKVPILYWLSFMAPIIIWGSIIWQQAIWDRRKAIAILQYRDDAPTFWEENRGPIIITLIVGLASTVLGALLLRAIPDRWPGASP
jgi:hypothetical protein